MLAVPNDNKCHSPEVCPSRFVTSCITENLRGDANPDRARYSEPWGIQLTESSMLQLERTSIMPRLSILY